MSATKRVVFAVVVWVVLIIALLTAGCFLSPSSPPKTSESTSAAASPGGGVGKVLRDIGSAPAAAVVSDKLGPFFWAGLAFIVVGGLSFVFKAPATGINMILLGIIVAGVGVLYASYPWVVLPSYAVAAIMTLAKVIDARRKEKAKAEVEGEKTALEEFAKVAVAEIENTPGGKDVKAGIKGRGSDVMAMVRSIADPIKDELEKAGVISRTTGEAAKAP